MRCGPVKIPSSSVKVAGVRSGESNLVLLERGHVGVVRVVLMSKNLNGGGAGVQCRNLHDGVDVVVLLE